MTFAKSAWPIRRLFLVLAFMLAVTSTEAIAAFRYVTPSPGRPLIIFVHGFWSDPDNAFRANASAPSWADIMRGDTKSVRGERPLSDYATATLSFPAWCSSSMSTAQIAGRLLRELYDEAVWERHPYIIFIAHSLGGIIVQEMLVNSSSTRKKRGLAERTRAVLLMGTPTQGSEDAVTLAQALERLPSAVASCPLLKELQTVDSNPILDQYDRQWRRFIASLDELPGGRRLHIGCYFETLRTWGRMIVPMHRSAQVCDGDRTAIDANHETLVKPTSMDAEVYRYIRGGIAEIDLQSGRLPKPLPQTERAPLVVPPVAPEPHRASVIDKRANTFVEGKGYLTLTGSSWDQCVARCEADQRCQMIEFYKPQKECNLYNHGKTGGSARTADVGIKTFVGLGGYRRRHMARLAGSYVEGKGFTRSLNLTAERCEAMCAENDRCLMFEFHKPAKECNLYDHRNAHRTSSNDNVVGIKATTYADTGNR